jgi:uncharacterized membrane protein YqjE
VSTNGDSAGNGHGLSSAAKVFADRASSIVKLELELASLELKRKVRSLMGAAGLAVGAVVLAFFGLLFLLAAAGAALALVLATWLAMLVMFAILVGIAIVLGIVGLRLIRKATPPVPEQAIEEAKLTAEALKR